MRGENLLSRFDSIIGDNLLKIMQQNGIICIRTIMHGINLHSDGRKNQLYVTVVRLLIILMSSFQLLAEYREHGF